MRFAMPLMAACFIVAASGCSYQSHNALLAKMTREERGALGKWQSVPEPGSTGDQLSKMFAGQGDKEAAPILSFEANKTFVLSAMDSEVSGTWHSDQGLIRLQITSVDGLQPSKVMQASKEMEQKYQSGSMPSASEFQEAFKNIMRGTLLSAVESLRELELNSDQKQLTSKVNLPNEAGLFGFGRVFRKVEK